MPRNPNGDVLSNLPRPVRPIGALVGRLPYTRFIWKKMAWIGIFSECRWLAISALERLKLSLRPESQKSRAKAELDATSIKISPGSLITIAIPSRKLGNPDSRLDDLLMSFKQMTAHPERCEILVKVDEDDDLPFYRDIVEKFSDLNLRFFVTPRGQGHAGVHKMFASLLDNASVGSKAGLYLCDDCVMCQKDWDLQVYDLIDDDNVFIIGHKSPKEMMSLRLVSEDPMPHYGYDDEGAPVFSLKLIDGVRSASQGLDGWTSVGNLAYVDCFMASIVHILHEHHDITVYHQVDQYVDVQNSRVARTKAIQYKNDKMAEALVKFFEPVSVQERRQLVSTMCQTGLFASTNEGAASADN